MRRPKQTELKFRGWGGRREGAARPRGGRVSHERRPQFGRVPAAHVTLRMRHHVWNLRSGRCHRRICRSLIAARGRFGLRVIEFSILGNHVPFIVEADDDVALTRGMQGLAIRIARALNDLMGRSGRVFADHYHSRLLRSPTELARAIDYVLGNASHHYGVAGADPYASDRLRPGERAGMLGRPLGWLLRQGTRLARGRAPPGAG